MEYVELGKTGIKISRIGIGTWQWGTKSWGYGRDYTYDDLKKAFERALDLGINFIDTAEFYGGGKSEEIIGDFLQGRREDVVVASKVWPTHLSYKGVLKAFERSSNRLKTDYIDLYYVHWPNPLIPMSSTAKAFLKLFEEGKIRAIGVSNFDLKRMIKFNNLVNGNLSANQVKYSLLKRDAEKKLLPYCLENNITLVAYSPIDQGAVTGKYDESNLPKDFWRKINPVFTKVNMRKIKPLIDTLKEIGDKHGVEPINVALRYLIEMGAVPIIGVKRVEHVEGIAKTFEFRMDRDDIERLKNVLDSINLSGARARLEMIKRLLFG